MAVLTAPSIKFYQKGETFCAQYPKKIKKQGFSEKIFLLEAFIMECSVQFFKSWREIFQKRAAITSIFVVNAKHLMFPRQKRVFLKCYSGHIECSFAVLTTTLKKLSHDLERSLLNVLKNLIENSQFFKKRFSSEWSPGNEDCSFETFARIFPRKGQSFPLKLRYWYEKIFLLRNETQSKDSSAHIKCIFVYPVEAAWPKAEN